MAVRIALLGYGNLTKGVEAAITQNDDLELVAVFTRRDPAALTIATPGVPVLHESALPEWKDRVDVLVLGGGSATDLPVQTPKWASMFNVVDSFDTHANIPTHFANVDAAAKQGGKTAIISAGWDPGMFSLLRMISEAILPEGKHYTFWGKGVSQGHSDAIRRIPGVLDARQYTIPIEETVDKVRSGDRSDFTAREMHRRECFVVAEQGADLAAIENAIKTMPNYFDAYDTTVHFISAEELAAEHSGLPHGGFVLRSGVTGLNKENNHIIEYRLKLDSNPQFTGSVLAACARAVCRMHTEGVVGCKTMFDVPPAYLSAKSGEELLRTLL